MKESQLVKLCKKWVNILNLPEWSITILVSPREEVPCQMGAGCEYDYCHHEATIHIAEDEFKDADDEHIEEMVVHELLHLLLSVAWMDEENNPWVWFATELREDAINRITKALMRK